MSEAQNCNHDCGSCTANCDSRVPDKKSFEEKLAEGCSVKKVIGVVSGKGGVGKSLVTSLMACQMRARGYKVGSWTRILPVPPSPNPSGSTIPSA